MKDSSTFHLIHSNPPPPPSSFLLYIKVKRMSARDIKTSNAPEPKVYVSTAKRKLPLTPEELANLDKPKVLIVGAGIGGITLGILLKKAGIDFTIYERAKEVKPLGKMAPIHLFGHIYMYLALSEAYTHPWLSLKKNARFSNIHWSDGVSTLSAARDLGRVPSARQTIELDPHLQRGPSAQLYYGLE